MGGTLRDARVTPTFQTFEQHLTSLSFQLVRQFLRISLGTIRIQPGPACIKEFNRGKRGVAREFARNPIFTTRYSVARYLIYAVKTRRYMVALP